METVQRIIVMRHGERLDTQDPSWKKTAQRVYDTPITSKGKQEALRVSQARFKSKDIKIIYSSPFLRCLQTAQQVSSAIGVEGLCVSKNLGEIMSSNCGLTGSPDVPCEDIESYEVNIKENDLGEFPKFPESTKEATERYKAEFKRLADKHWPDNLLLVTHEYGVMSAMGLAEHHEDVEATYCSSVELYRKEQAQQNWCVGRHHGVYKYDSLID